MLNGVKKVYNKYNKKIKQFLKHLQKQISN